MHSYTHAGIYEYPNLSVERKASLCLGIIFMCVAATHVAKLTRDLEDKLLGPRVSLSYRLFVYAGFVVSLAFQFGFLFLMPLDPGQQKFATIGSLFTLSSVLNLAKLMRDREEKDKAEAEKADKAE
jgi:hypothetical protein